MSDSSSATRTVMSSRWWKQEGLERDETPPPCDIPGPASYHPCPAHPRRRLHPAGRVLGGRGRRATVRRPIAAGGSRVPMHLADLAAVPDEPRSADRPTRPL